MWVFLWQEPNGERKWETVKDGQTEGFLSKLLNSGVHPATVMVASNPLFFHWVWKQYHKGLSDVTFMSVDKEIYGTEPIKNNHKPVDVPVKKRIVSKFGWLAPDGRFFTCEYGGHSNLADKIVGEIERVTNPERHLEDKGWAKIMSGGGTGRQYAIGMGIEKKLTDAQLKTLKTMKLDDAFGISFFL